MSPKTSAIALTIHSNSDSENLRDAPVSSLILVKRIYPGISIPTARTTPPALALGPLSVE